MGIAALKKVRVIFGPIINAVVNAVTAASRYTFNGTDMHATIPNWTPLGLPFEIIVEARFVWECKDLYQQNYWG